MRRGRRALVAALALLGVAAALAFAVLGPADPTPNPDLLVDGEEIRVTTSLEPRFPAFGDTVRATVDVVLDPRRVDPESVRIETDFAPWELVARPKERRRAVAGAVLVQAEHTLRCTTGPCLPGGATQASRLPAARVTYAPLEGPERRAARAEWPLLVVSSRLAASALDTSDPAPFRADLVTLPPPTTPIAPVLLAAGIGGVAALLACLGAALVALAWPPARPEPERPPQPERATSLSPLERALALLEESTIRDGAGERRRALELVAGELEAWGDDDLAGIARALAWSSSAPEGSQTDALVARVRGALALARAGRETDERGPDGE